MSPDEADGQPPREQGIARRSVLRGLGAGALATGAGGTAAATLLPGFPAPVGKTGRQEVRLTVAIQSRGHPRKPLRAISRWMHHVRHTRHTSHLAPPAMWPGGRP